VALDRFASVLGGFRRWAAASGRQLRGNLQDDVPELFLLFNLMHGEMELGRPEDLAAGDVRTLLLEVYPQHVMVARRDGNPCTVPAMQDLLAFLVDTRRISPQRGDALERELDDAARLFADVLFHSPMSRELHEILDEDGIDVDATDAVDRWMEQQAAAARRDWSAERAVELRESFGLPAELPPLRLPEPAELAALARSSELLAAFRKLTGWLADNPVVGTDGSLTMIETARATAALGIDRHELALQLRALADAEFIKPDGTIADKAFRLLGHASDDVLDVWTQVFTAVLCGTIPAETARDMTRSRCLNLDGQGMFLGLMLFLARRAGLSLPEASGFVKCGATSELSEAIGAWESWIAAHGDPAETLLRRLERHSAVTIADDRVRLAPLGLWAIRGLLVSGGIDIPLLPPPGEMTAVDVLALAAQVDDEELGDEVEAWLAGRDPEQAAGELLHFASLGGPLDRMSVSAILAVIGPAARSAWREVLGHPELTSYAKSALSAAETHTPRDLELTLPDVAWMLTDLLAVHSDVDDPGWIAEQLDRPELGGELAAIEAISRLPHPDAVTVLAHIGRAHPDKKIAKAARKAAHAASTRGGGNSGRGWLPGAGRGAVAADGPAARAGDLAGAIRASGEQPAPPVDHHIMVEPAEHPEVPETGVTTVLPVSDMVALAAHRGLVTSAGKLASSVITQAGQAAQVRRDLVGLPHIQRQARPVQALVQQRAAQE